jgi:hypothetical protein
VTADIPDRRLGAISLLSPIVDRVGMVDHRDQSSFASRLTARASFLTQPPFSGAFVLMQLPFNVIERVSLPYHLVPRMVFTAERSETHTPSDCIDQTECACNRHHTEKSD